MVVVVVFGVVVVAGSPIVERPGSDVVVVVSGVFSVLEQAANASAIVRETSGSFDLGKASMLRE